MPNDGYDGEHKREHAKDGQDLKFAHGTSFANRPPTPQLASLEVRSPLLSAQTGFP